MFKFFPNIIGPLLSFGARSPHAGASRTSAASFGELNKWQSTAGAVKKNEAESIAFSRLSAEFRTFAGSDRNAQNLVIGLRDGSEIILEHNVSGNSFGLSFEPPTGRMGYSNVAIALSLARQFLSGQGIKRPTTQQLQATLVGGTIESPKSGNRERLEGILQLKAQGMGWGKIAAFLGIKLGSVIGEVRPVPAVLQPRASSYVRRADKEASKAITTIKMPPVEGNCEHVTAQTLQSPETNTKQAAL